MNGNPAENGQPGFGRETKKHPDPSKCFLFERETRLFARQSPKLLYPVKIKQEAGKSRSCFCKVSKDFEEILLKFCLFLEKEKIGLYLQRCFQKH
jgi:hypothetical protein